MLETLLAPVTKFVLALISGWGYAGIVVCMTIESACIPLPSEIIMPFSGYLVSTGRFTLWGVALAGAVGNVFGSWIGYALGLAGGRPLAERLSRWRILRVAEYDRANGWLVRHGTQVAFWTRLLPIVRTFISFPAGAARVPLGRFTLYTFLSAWPGSEHRWARTGRPSAATRADSIWSSPWASWRSSSSGSGLISGRRKAKSRSALTVFHADGSLVLLSGGSSSGRTRGSGPRYRGSNPLPPATSQFPKAAGAIV